MKSHQAGQVTPENRLEFSKTLAFAHRRVPPGESPADAAGLCLERASAALELLAAQHTELAPALDLARLEVLDAVELLASTAKPVFAPASGAEAGDAEFSLTAEIAALRRLMVDFDTTMVDGITETLDAVKALGAGLPHAPSAGPTGAADPQGNRAI